MKRLAAILGLLAIVAVAQAQSVRTHTVRPGQTLFSISKSYGLTVDQLKAYNGISGTVIRVGQRLNLDPEPAAIPPPPPAPVEAEETPSPPPPAPVEAEETPSPPPPAPVEAEETPAPPPAPVEAEETPAPPPAPVEAGETPAPPPAQEATLLETPDPEPPAAPRPPPPAAQLGEYPVSESVSLFDVAFKTGLSVDSLVALNPDLEPVLSEDGRILVPREYAVRPYRVKAGDTLFRIAAREGASVESIRAVNSIRGDRIGVGQTLNIPGVESAARAVESLPKPAFTGKVSVYPSRFAGRLTAGGDPYEPGRLTVAHTDLEMGTLILITHPESGRSVFAEVNDRMPVRTDFVLEVSEAVDEALRAGSDPVTVRIVRGVE